jgi:hypothetical protein
MREIISRAADDINICRGPRSHRALPLSNYGPRVSTLFGSAPNLAAGRDGGGEANNDALGAGPGCEGGLCDKPVSPRLA